MSSSSPQRRRRFRRLLCDALEPRHMLASFLWTGASDGSWSAPGNWMLESGTDLGADGVPSQGDSARFDTTAGATNVTLDLPGVTQLAALEFAAANSSAFVLAPALGSSLDVATSFLFSGSADVAVHVPLAGTASFVKQGTGTAILSAANTYSGTTTVDGGTLQIGTGGGSGSVGSGGVALAAPGVLRYQRDNVTTLLDHVFSGTGTLQFAAGDFELSAVGSSVGSFLVANAANVSTTVPLAVTSLYEQGDRRFEVTSGELQLSGNDLAEAAQLSVGNAAVRLVPLGGPAAFASPGTSWQIDGNASFDLSQATSVVLDTAVLASGANLAFFTPLETLYDAVVTGGGGVAKTGAGTLTFTAAQLYTGPTTLEQGTLRLGIDNALPITTRLTMGSGSTNATLDLAGHAQRLAGLTLASGAGAGQVVGSSSTMQPATLTLVIASSETFGGELRDTLGAGTQTLSITKEGAGALTLTGASSYTGPTQITAGTLLLQGSLGNSAVAVSPGATLQGSGSVSGAVTSQGGFVAPGVTEGELATGSITFDAASTFNWQMQAPFNTAGVDYDQLRVTGTVALNGAMLSVSSSSLADTPVPGTQFILVANDGNADSVVGTFAGLAEGATLLTGGGYRFSISYVGGDGNDVVLTALTRLPLVVDDTYAAVEDTPFVVPTLTGVLANDMAFAGVTVELVAPPATGLLQLEPTGGFTFTPASNQHGPVSFTYRAKNAGGEYSPTTATVTLNVAPVNDPPTITSSGGGSLATLQMAENGTFVETVVATDLDLGDSIAYSLDPVLGADRTHFALDATTGELTFLTPPDFENPTDADFDGTYEVVVVATDGAGANDTQLILVTITNGNDAPQFVTSAMQSQPESTLSLQLTASDQDTPPPVFTFSLVGGVDQARFLLDGATGLLSFAALAGDFDQPTDANLDNVYEVEVQVSDGFGGTSRQLFFLTRTPIDDNNPVITSPAAVSVPENQLAVQVVTAADADLPAAALTFALSGGEDESRFTLDATTGVLAFLVAGDFEAPHDLDFDGLYRVTVTASDGSGPVASQDLVVTLTGVNDFPPVITTPNTASVAENTLAVLDVDATDGDLPSSSLTFSLAGGADAAQFTIDSATGLLQFVVPPNFEAPTDTNLDRVYEVTVGVSDGTLSTTQAVTVSVTDVNDPPVITSGGGGDVAQVEVLENVASVLNVVVVNDEGGVPRFRIAGGADAGLFSISNFGGNLAFKTAPDFELPTDANGDNVYEVIVAVDDFETPAASDSQTILVTVRDTANPSLRLFLNAATGSLTLNDEASRNDRLRISLAGASLVVADTTTNLDQVIEVDGVPTATGSGTKTVTIPLTTFTATGKPFILNTGLGNDIVVLDTNGAAADSIPAFGLTVNFSGGTDTLDLDDNTTSNVWTVGNSQSGSVKVGGFGSATFSGIERLIGGEGQDEFVIAHTLGNGITLLDGDVGHTLDAVRVTRDANFVLSDTKLVIDHSIDQTFTLANIQRAFLTGGSGANLFDVSGWTRAGVSSATSFGGKLYGRGGADVVLKRRDVESFTLTDSSLHTSDGMRLQLATITGATLEDLGSGSPVTFDVSGWSRGGSLVAPDHKANTLVVNRNFNTLSLTNVSLKVNTFPLLNLTGVQSARITGGASPNVATFQNVFWTGGLTFDGGGGSDTIIRNFNGDFSISDSALQAAGQTISLASVEVFQVRGGFSNNRFDLKGWSGRGTIDGQGGSGDEVIVERDATSFTLSSGSLTTSGNGPVQSLNFSAIEHFSLMGGNSPNTFALSGWTGSSSVHGGGGTDTLQFTGDRDYILGPGRVTTSGFDNLYTNVENLSVRAGLAANTFTLQSGFRNGLTGLDLTLDAGVDTLAIEENGDVFVTQTGSSTLDIQIQPFAGPAVALALTGNQFPERLHVLGGAGNNTIRFDNYSGFGSVNGAGGSDRLQFVRNANFTLTTLTEPEVQTTLELDGRDFTLVDLEALELTAGSGNNAFDVDGWTGGLTLNGGTGNDRFKLVTASHEVTLTQALLQQSSAADVVLSSIEDIELVGADVDQTFDLSLWQRGGSVHARGGQDQIVFARDLDMTLFNNRLEYGSGPSAFTWVISSVEQAKLTGGASANYLNAVSFTGEVELRGEDGNDVLLGADGNDFLDGGVGHDWVFGGSGEDEIAGGLGNDILVGGIDRDVINTVPGDGLGEDIVIGGRTTYDTNKAAIDAFLAVWAAALSFNTRVQLINATGVGSSGQFKLQVRDPSSPPTIVTTVFNDGVPDVLFGGEDLDWFFVAAEGSGKELGLDPPHIDNGPGEVVTDL